MKVNKNNALEKYFVARAPLIKYIRKKKIMFKKKKPSISVLKHTYVFSIERLVCNRDETKIFIRK